MADTTRVRILDIDASKSTNSIASLKSEIKSLKSRLMELDEGTEEYNKVLTECANKTHELKEIQEKVNASSTDFGDRMSNVRQIVGGAAGAIGAITGALSLMGLEADKDSKLMKIMVSAMSITSGIQAIDSGIKAFKALTVSIRTATKASSEFKMSFAGWAGAIAAAVGVAMGAIKLYGDEMEKKRKERMEANYKETQQWKDDWAKAISELDLTGMLDEDAAAASESAGRFVSAVVGAIEAVSYNEGETHDEYLKRMKELETQFLAEKELAEKEFAELLRKRRENPDWEFTEEGVQAWELYYAKVRDIAVKLGLVYNGVNEEGWESVKKMYEDAEKESDAFDKKVESKRKSNATKASQDRLKSIKDEYNLENSVAKMAYNANEIDEVEYYDRMYFNLVDYNNKVKKASKQTAAELKAMELAEQEAAMKTAQARAKALEDEIGHALKMNTKANVQRPTAGDSNAVAAENSDIARGVGDFFSKYEESGYVRKQKMFEDYQKWLTETQDRYEMLRLGRAVDALEEELDVLEQNRQIDLDNEEMAYRASVAILDAKHDEGLLGEKEYANQLEEIGKSHSDAMSQIDFEYAETRASIEAEITDTELAASQRRIEIAEAERQAKTEKVQRYASAASSALSMTSQLIGAIQGNIDKSTKEGFEQNKRLEVANSTISYLQGLISAWSSSMQLGPIAGPIAGGVLTALLTGIYAANLSQIKSTTLSGSGAGSAASARQVTLQSIEHPVSNVRQTTTSSDYEELNGNVAPQKVYVLASEIEETMNDRKATVSNATY